MTGGDKRRQIRQSSIQLLAAARPSSIQLFNMIHAHTLLHCFTHSLATRPPVPSNFAQEKKTKKIFAKNYFFTHCSISIFWRNGAMSKRKTSLVPPSKSLQLCQYTGHFLCENFFHLQNRQWLVAGGWFSRARHWTQILIVTELLPSYLLCLQS